MLENFMIFSVFLTVLCTLVILGLLVVAGLYFVLDNLRERRKGHNQRKLEKAIEMIRLDDFEKEDTNDDY